MTYTGPLSWRRQGAGPWADPVTLHAPSACPLFRSLVERCLATGGALPYEHWMGLYEPLEGFCRRSYTHLAARGDRHGPGDARVASAVHDLAEGSLDLTVVVWRALESRRHTLLSPADGGDPTEKRRRLGQIHERHAYLLLQIQALRATQGQDPCPSFRHVLARLQAEAAVRVSDDAKALIKYYCIQLHRARWREVYRSITHLVPRVTMRETHLTPVEEAAERQRLSRALQLAPSGEAAWMLCAMKREDGVRLTLAHYRAVLDRLHDTLLSTPGDACAGPSARWLVVEQCFMALLRDGVTPDTAWIEAALGVVGHTTPTTSAEDRRAGAQGCLCFASMLTLLPPITNARHRRPRRDRHHRPQRQGSREARDGDGCDRGGDHDDADARDNNERTEPNAYGMTRHIIDTVLDSCTYVVDAYLGTRTAQLPEAERALTALHDTVELTASFALWLSRFSRLPRMAEPTVARLAHLCSTAFSLQTDGDGVHWIGQQSCAQLLAAAFPRLGSGDGVAFGDAREDLRHRLPPQVEAGLAMALKQKHMHQVELPFWSMVPLFGAATAVHGHARYTRQQLASLARGPTLDACQRASLAATVAEQSLWQLPSGPHRSSAAPRSVPDGLSPRRLWVHMESAYVTALASFLPESSALYHDMVLARPAARGACSVADGEGPDHRRGSTFLAGTVPWDVEGGGSGAPVLPAELLASLATLEDLVQRTEPTADLSLAYRHVLTELCRHRAWREVRRWVEPVLPVPWPLRPEAHAQGMPPRGEAAAMARHVVADSFMLHAISACTRHAAGGAASTDRGPPSPERTAIPTAAQSLQRLVCQALAERAGQGGSLLHVVQLSCKAGGEHDP